MWEQYGYSDRVSRSKGHASAKPEVNRCVVSYQPKLAGVPLQVVPLRLVWQDARMTQTETFAQFIRRTRHERSYGASVIASLLGLSKEDYLPYENADKIPTGTLAAKFDEVLTIGPERMAALIENTAKLGTTAGGKIAELDSKLQGANRSIAEYEKSLRAAEAESARLGDSLESISGKYTELNGLYAEAYNELEATKKKLADASERLASLEKAQAVVPAAPPAPAAPAPQQPPAKS